MSPLAFHSFYRPWQNNKTTEEENFVFLGGHLTLQDPQQTTLDNDKDIAWLDGSKSVYAKWATGQPMVPDIENDKRDLGPYPLIMSTRDGSIHVETNGTRALAKLPAVSLLPFDYVDKDLHPICQTEMKLRGDG